MRRKEARAGVLLAAPFLVVFVAMLVVPLGYSAYLSTFRHQLIGGTTFIGLDNYWKALHDPQFLAGVARVGYFLVVQVPIMLGLAVLLALLLDSGMLRLHRFVRLGAFVPYAVPAVVAALMWGYLYGPDFGPFAQVARWFGTPAPEFLAPGHALYSIMNIVTWSFVGYNMVILYAALRAVPGELYEAARVDGAGEIRIAWAIKIPALRPALILTTIFSIIGSFQLFNEPKILSTLAPTVIGSSYTPNIYSYSTAFVNQDLNYAAAIAFLLGFVIMVVSFAFQTLTRRKAGAR
jgi:multiple sugar transport system permease protein